MYSFGNGEHGTGGGGARNNPTTSSGVGPRSDI